MGQTYRRKLRQRMKPLSRLRAAAQHDLDVVCQEVGVRPSPEEQRQLISETLRFADPYLFDDRDAALPAQRWDLRQTWFRWRLAGNGMSDAARVEKARALAPCPGIDVPRGRTRWDVPDPRDGEITRAFRELHQHYGPNFNPF